MGIYNQWTGLADWTSELDCWTLLYPACISFQNDTAMQLNGVFYLYRSLTFLQHRAWRLCCYTVHSTATLTYSYVTTEDENGVVYYTFSMHGLEGSIDGPEEGFYEECAHG